MLIDGGHSKDDSDMSMSCRLQKDPLHDMYCVLLGCRSFQNESGMCTKSIEVVRAMVCSMDAKDYTATTWKLGWCLTFYIPVWASSWGAKLYFFSEIACDISPLI